YDNLMYIAAGQIIPAVTQSTWEDYVKQTILHPLGMTATNFSNSSWRADDNYAWPHSKIPGVLQAIDFVPLDNAAPAGAINSSAAEMAKWMLLQLNRGKFPDREGRL